MRSQEYCLWAQMSISVTLNLTNLFMFLNSGATVAAQSCMPTQSQSDKNIVLYSGKPKTMRSLSNMSRAWCQSLPQETFAFWRARQMKLSLRYKTKQDVYSGYYIVRHLYFLCSLQLFIKYYLFALCWINRITFFFLVFSCFLYL